LDRMAQTILRQIKHSPKGTTPKFKRDQWGSKGASTRAGVLASFHPNGPF
jgi:hypothetical protein